MQQPQQTKSPAEFLQMLYPSQKRGYLSLLTKEGKQLVPRAFIPASEPEQADQFVARYADKDIYYSVGLLPAKPASGRGTAEDIIALPGLYLDVDISSGSHASDRLPSSWEQVQEIIADLPEPSLVVFTGGGYHLYWLFDKPYKFMDGAKAAQLSKLWQAMYIARFKAEGLKLDNTSDLSRVLRLPGSTNYKGSPIPVTILKDTGLRYTKEELQEIAEDDNRTREDIRDSRKAQAPTGITVSPEQALEMLRTIPVAPDHPNRLHHDDKFSIAAALYATYGEETAKSLLYQAWADQFQQWLDEKLPTLEGKEYGYSIGTLIHFALQYGYRPPKREEEPLPIKYEQDSRYVDIREALGAEHCLVVKSTKGTGKTEALARYLSDNPEKTAIIVGHRMALLRSMAYRLGTAYYMEEGGKISDSSVLAGYHRLAITLDSAYKLPPDKRYDLVIIDEAEQVLSHATGSTLRERRGDCYATLRALCRFADKVVALDADISRVSYNFLSREDMQLAPAVLVNSYKANTNRYLTYETKGAWIESLRQAAKDGLRLFVAANSKQMVKSLSRMLEKEIEGLRLYTITADNSTSDDAQNFIVDINEQIRQYDVLIASPSIGTGVSIDARYFDRVYLFGEADVNTATDLLQQAARVRTILSGEVHTWINGKRSLHPTEPKELIKWALKNAKETDELANTMMVSLETGEPVIKRDEEPYVELWADVTARRNESLNDLRAAFAEAVVAEGGTVEPAPAVSETAAKAAAADLKSYSQAVKDEFVDTVLQVEKIDYLDYINLKDKANLTDQQRAQVYRYELADYYGIPDETITENLIRQDREGLKHQVASLSLLLSPEDEVIKLDARDIGKGLLAPDKGNYLIAKRLRADLLERAGIAGLPSGTPILYHSNEKAGKLKQQEYGAYVYANRHRISSLLGLRPRRDVTDKPMQFVGALLAQLGLSLEMQTVWGKDGAGKRVKRRVYSISKSGLDDMLRMVELYRAARQIKDEEWIIVDSPDQD